MLDIGCRLSEIDLVMAKKHLVIEDDFIEDDDLITLFVASAKDYIKSCTNLPLDALDEHPSFSVACLMLVSDFYEVRTVNLGGEKNSAINKMLTSIISLNRDLG